MKNPYRRKTNPKVIALIVEIVVFVMFFIVVLILDANGYKFNPIIALIVGGIFLFALIVTLSKIRYESIRAVRSEGYYTNEEDKKVFLNLYDDQTSLICHDLKDESQKEKTNK